MHIVHIRYADWVEPSLITSHKQTIGTFSYPFVWASALQARKALRHLRGTARVQALTEGHCIGNQTSNALSHIHSWSRIEAHIRARRFCMVAEGRARHKKLENQLKLEAKLHDLQVEWCGGPETMEEILSRIHQREETAFKRERAMSYAFSHQL